METVTLHPLLVRILLLKLFAPIQSRFRFCGLVNCIAETLSGHARGYRESQELFGGVGCQALLFKYCHGACKVGVTAFVSLWYPL